MIQNSCKANLEKIENLWISATQVLNLYIFTFVIHYHSKNLQKNGDFVVKITFLNLIYKKNKKQTYTYIYGTILPAIQYL